MKPLYERILVEPKEKETRTQAGIMLPEKAVKRPNIGTVIACGDGSSHNPMLVQPGDIILFNRFAGIEVFYKNTKHFVIMANEVIAKLENYDEISLDEFE